MILEELLREEEQVENTLEGQRKKKRLEQILERGANYVSTALQRMTVRSLKFIRWVRNFVYREVAWDEAVARLRQIYASW